VISQAVQTFTTACQVGELSDSRHREVETLETVAVPEGMRFADPRTPVRDAGVRRVAMTVVVLAVWVAIGLAAGSGPGAQQPAQIWPSLHEDQWHWVDIRSDLPPKEVESILLAAAAHAPKFQTPEYANAIFTVRQMKLKTKSKVVGLEVNGDWTATNSDHRGRKTVFVPLDPMTSPSLLYQTGVQYSWNVEIHAEATYDFYFKSDELARSFINAVVSARRRGAAPVRGLKFGLTSQDLTPQQAEDAGRPRVDSVLIRMVALGGPADRARIQALDVILEFNGTAVMNQYHFDQLISTAEPGTSVTLALLRRTRAPEGTTKQQGPEGVRYPYIWERKTVTVTVQ
jgi:hypothetical protein